MTDRPRTCLACTHFSISFEGDWSDITPGEGFSMKCYAKRPDGSGYGHFPGWDGVDLERKPLKDFHATTQTALNCPDYQPLDWYLP